MSVFTIEICGFTFLDSESPPAYVTNSLESYYSVDYYLEVNPGYLIGLQSKSSSSKGNFALARHKGINRNNYRRFKKKYHGPVLEYDRDEAGNVVVWDKTTGKRKRGKEACQLIKDAISRLEVLSA